MLFIVVSSTIGVFLVERESRVTAISPEQNIFSEVHTIQIFKNLQGTLRCLTLDLQTRYTVASALIDRQIDRQTHRTTTVTLRCMRRGLMKVPKLVFLFFTIPYSRKFGGELNLTVGDLTLQLPN